MLGSIALLVLWVALVFPELERQAQQAPLVNAIMAVRRGDVDGVRAVFTPEATIRARLLRLPAPGVLTMAAPLIRERGREANVRFDGLRNPQRAGKTLTADFWVWIYVERADAPGRRIPLHRSGQVVLEKTGILRWQIRELASDEGMFDHLITGQEP